MTYTSSMTEEEWEMCGGFGFAIPDNFAEVMEKANKLGPDRHCKSCVVGWKVSQDGENCWSCGVEGIQGVVK